MELFFAKLTPSRLPAAFTGFNFDTNAANWGPVSKTQLHEEIIEEESDEGNIEEEGMEEESIAGGETSQEI